MSQQTKPDLSQFIAEEFGANAREFMEGMANTEIGGFFTIVRDGQQGQAPNIRSQAVFKAAISIHPVEARHAAWIRQLAHQSPAPAAFNPALTKDQVLAAVTATGFIKG